MVMMRQKIDKYFFIIMYSSFFHIVVFSKWSISILKSDYPPLLTEQYSDTDEQA